MKPVNWWWLNLVMLPWCCVWICKANMPALTCGRAMLPDRKKYWLIGIWKFRAVFDFDKIKDCYFKRCPVCMKWRYMEKGRPCRRCEDAAKDSRLSN